MHNINRIARALGDISIALGAVGLCAMLLAGSFSDDNYRALFGGVTMFGAVMTLAVLMSSRRVKRRTCIRTDRLQRSTWLVETFAGSGLP